MDEPKSKPCVGLVAVMGGTGTGKSSFINSIIGQEAAPVGHELESETSEIGKYDYTTAGGIPVTLVDTPGFNDFRDGGGKSDFEILKMISAFLKEQYDEDQKFSGILYLHNINEPRIGSVKRRNMTMFKNLCGNASMKNVVVVTTFWDATDLNDAIRRETEIKTEKGILKELLDGGASFVRSGHFPDGTHPQSQEFRSPQKIVDGLLALDPVFVKMQKELADGLTVAQTAAGSELDKEFEKLKREYRKEMHDVNAKIEGLHASNEAEKEARRKLIEANERLASQMQQWEEERHRMQLRLEDYHATLVQQKSCPNEMDLLRQQHESDVCDLRNQIQFLLASNSTSNSQRTLLRRSNTQLKSALSEAFSTIKELRVELNSRASECRDLRSSLNARYDMERELESKIHENQTTLSENAFELRTLRNEKNESLDELQQVRVAFAQVTEDFELSKQNHVSEIEDLRSGLGKAKLDLQATETIHGEAVAELQELRPLFQKMRSDFELSNRELDDTKRLLAWRDAELASLQQDYLQQRSELWKCLPALVHAREELNILRASQAKLASELEDAQEFIRAHGFGFPEAPNPPLTRYIPQITRAG